MNTKTLTKEKCLTYYIFAFWFTTEVFQGINLQSIAGIPLEALAEVQAILTLTMLVIQIAWFQDYTKREFWCIAGITVLLGVSMLLSGARNLFSAWLFIVASQKVDFDKIVGLAYRILLVTLVAVILLYFAGVIPDPLYYRGERLRLSLGFMHPNTFGMRLFQLSTCHFYLRRDRLRWWDSALLLAFAAFAYVVPNSQTATIGILFTVLVMLGIRLKVKISVWWAVSFAACMPVVSVVLSWVDLQKYPVLARIDRLLSSRFTCVHTVWQRYGVTIFGNRIYVTPEERALIGLEQHLWLDNAYGSILLRHGIAVLLLFTAGYLYTICWHGKRRHGVLVCFLVLYAVYGVEENYLHMLSFNIFLLAMAPVLYGQRTASDAPPEVYFHFPALVGKIRECNRNRE